MLLRYKLEGNMDWVCRTHITVPLAGTTWTLAMVVPSSFTDEQIKDLMLIPEELNDVTQLHQGVSAITRENEQRKEKKAFDRREYQRERYRRQKENGNRFDI